MAEVRIRLRPGRQRVDTAAIQRFVRGPAVRRELNARAERVATFVRLQIPMRTGRLRQSVRVADAPGARPAVRVLLGQGLPYGHAYVLGARPHEIRPRRKKALRFVSGGRVVFAQKVQHPGWRGEPVFERARPFWRD